MNEQYINKIIQDDCFNVLENLENESIDVIITDPPYNKKQGFENDDLSREEFMKFTRKWIELSIEKLKKNGSFYCFINEDYLFAFKLLMDKYMIFKRLVIWNFEPSYRGFSNNFDNRCEYVLFYVKSKNYVFNIVREKVSKSTVSRFKRYINEEGYVPYEKLSPSHKKRYKKENYEKNPRRIDRGSFLGNVLRVNRCVHPNHKELIHGRHPTQKPEKLLEKLIKVSSNKGNLILDCFCGSGTTCVIAKKLGRNFIGIELEKKFYDIAKKRLSSVVINNTNTFF